MRWKLRAWLFALVLVTALPCVSVFAWLTGASARHDRQEAERDARAIAEQIASRTDQKIEEARNLLEVLAQRPKVRALRPDQCDELLPDLRLLQPEYAGVLTADASGELVCSGAGVKTRISYAERLWFREAMSGKFSISGPKVGRVAKRWIVPLAAPIRDAQGRPIGAIVLSLDLLLLGPSLEPRGENGVRASIFDQEGTLIARSLDAANWVGKNFADRTYVARAIAHPSDAFEDTDLAGELRIYASAPAAGGRWRVLVSFSEHLVLAAVRTSRAQAAILGLAILAAAVGFGYWLNLRLVRPIRGLSEAALASRDQGAIRLAEVAGPEELRGAITHFNELVTARAEGENAVLQSGRRVAQLNRFLRTSWSVSQAISRAPDADAIFSEACRILVDSGGMCAAWAAVVGPDGVELRPAACVGLDGDELAAALRGAVSAGSARLFRDAVRTGARQVIEDLRADPFLGGESSALHLEAAGSAAAIPLLSGGKVSGALVVYAREAYAFDDGVLALLDELLREIGRGLGLLDEVANRRSAEAALRNSESRLLAADRLASLGRLSAGVAHEINNPLAYVVANTSFALEAVKRLAAAGTDDARGGAVLGEITEALQEACQGGDRVRLIVRDLKIFSRSEPATPLPVDLARVLDSTAQMAGNEIRHRARLVKAIDPGLPAVTGSESRLGQVFLNLLMNAAQAIEPGAADRNEIRISARLVDARVVVEVSDTGAGIDPETQERIFEPFFTTKPPGVGTGLGLSICHGIVSEMGGELSVESTPGKGSVFRVSLPVGVAAQEAAADSTGAVAPGSVPRGRVLIVDDEPAVGRAVARLLRDEHDVVSLPSARSALDWLRNGGSCDLLLCDIMMPEMTGIELHAVLQDIDPRLARHMIFITGGVFTAAAQKFLDAVPNRRAEKPFDEQRLRALVREAAAAQAGCAPEPGAQHARALPA
ncbi:MAG: hypothetical protein NVSMB23_20370 [Myxococcales bacterium]